MRGFLIDMVEWEWVKSTNKIKAVLLLGDGADDVAGVHEAQESNKNLSTAVNDLDVLVVYEAAHDGDVGMALCGADPRSLLHLVPHAARPMFAPPRVVGGDVKRQQVTVLGQAPYIQVEADDEDVPGYPQRHPHSVHHNVARPVLDGAKEAEDDDDDVEEVGEDWSPLVAQEVKDLPFQGHNQLQSANEDEGAPSAAAAHCVDGLDSDSEPAEKGLREAGKPV